MKEIHSSWGDPALSPKIDLSYHAVHFHSSSHILSPHSPTLLYDQEADLDPTGLPRLLVYSWIQPMRGFGRRLGEGEYEFPVLPPHWFATGWLFLPTDDPRGSCHMAPSKQLVSLSSSNCSPHFASSGRSRMTKDPLLHPSLLP